MPRRSLTGSWRVTSSAVDLDGAGRRLDQPVDHLQRRGLAAARRPDEAPPARRARPRGRAPGRPPCRRRRSCRRRRAGSSAVGRRLRAGNVHARDPTRARRPAGEPSCYSRITNEWFCAAVPPGPPGASSSTPPSSTSRSRWPPWSLGLLIAFPLALLARRLPRLESTILGSARRIYTIPSLALLPLLVPFTGLTADDGRDRPRALRAHGAGPQHARGPRGGARRGARVRDRAGLRRAPGCCSGSSCRSRTPVIMAGLRVATVSTVALTTVGSLVAYGGLGNLIKDGVNTNFRAELMTAAVLCVLLAVLLDAVIVVAQRVLTPWTAAGRCSHDRLRRHVGLPHRPRQLDGRRTACSHLLLQQLLLSVTALAVAARDRPAGRALAGAPRPRRLPGDQHLQRRPGRAHVRPAGAARHRRLPGHAPTSAPTAAPGLATLIALTLFALPPIITNAYVAVREVPADVKQAARRHGHDRRGRSSSGSSSRWRCRW